MEVRSVAYPAIDGVGSRQHATAGIQPGVDACLSDRDATLLHDLVDGRAIHVRHLVKLVDADHSPVRQHHGARF